MYLLNSLDWNEFILGWDVTIRMLKECHPSVKSTLFSSLVYDSRDNHVLPTTGMFARLKAVCLNIAMMIVMI